MSKLTIKQEKFCLEFIKTSNASESWRRVYDCSNTNEASIGRSAHKMMSNVKVMARINELKTEMSVEAKFGPEQVLKAWVTTITTDVNELITHRRVNCRHCWGRDHLYQWRNENEFAKQLGDALDANAIKEPGDKSVSLPNDRGGYGFRHNEKPHPKCPECEGEGYGEVFLADTSKVSAGAKFLYNGVQQTKDGIKILTLDRDGALQNVARFFSMFKDKDQSPSAGAGQPLPPPAAIMPTDPVEAAKFYRAFMDGVK